MPPRHCCQRCRNAPASGYCSARISHWHTNPNEKNRPDSSGRMRRIEIGLSWRAFLIPSKDHACKKGGVCAFSDSHVPPLCLALFRRAGNKSGVERRRAVETNKNVVVVDSVNYRGAHPVWIVDRLE